MYIINKIHKSNVEYDIKYLKKCNIFVVAIAIVIAVYQFRLYLIRMVIKEWPLLKLAQTLGI